MGRRQFLALSASSSRPCCLSGMTTDSSKKMAKGQGKLQDVSGKEEMGYSQHELGSGEICWSPLHTTESIFVAERWAVCRWLPPGDSRESLHPFGRASSGIFLFSLAKKVRMESSELHGSVAEECRHAVPARNGRRECRWEASLSLRTCPALTCRCGR